MHLAEQLRMSEEEDIQFKISYPFRDGKRITSMFIHPSVFNTLAYNEFVDNIMLLLPSACCRYLGSQPDLQIVDEDGDPIYLTAGHWVNQIKAVLKTTNKILLTVVR